jgi:Uncharacterized conserved protein
VKLHASAPSALNTFSGYGDGFVTVNGQRYEQKDARALIVMPERIVPWNAGSFDTLSAADFEVFAGLDLEVLLLGTGSRLRFPHPRLTASLSRRHVGVDAMDLQAACRTYNILMAEGRKVAAVLLLEPEAA